MHRIGSREFREKPPVIRIVRRKREGADEDFFCEVGALLALQEAGGDSTEDLLAEFPDLEREDILACHEFSRRMLAAKSVHLALQ